MLGKFKSLFNKDILEIRLDEVNSKVSDFKEKSQKEKLENSKKNIDSELKKLVSILQDLSKKQADDNYVNVLKNRFCEKGIKSINSGYADYESFISHVSLSLQEVSGISFKEFRHFHAFKEDMSKVAAQIKIIEQRFEEFKKIYFSSDQKKANDILSLSSTIRSKQAKILNLEKELQEIEKAIPFIKEALERDERKLQETSKKTDLMKSDLEDKINSMQSEMSIIKQKISTEFGSIDRLLKKVEYENPKKYSSLHEYILNAGDAFLDDDSLEIRTILEDIKHQVKKDDPGRYEKVLDLLRNIDFFDSLKQQYKGLEQKTDELLELKSRDLLPLEKEMNHEIISIEEKKTEISQLLEKRTSKSGEKEKLIQSVAIDRANLVEKLQDLMQKEVRLN